ncbi:alpha/beta hydrolase [Aliiroseovarius sp. KMU-50]|uniref:Alpha/beta hydrolase n=1 Tax=Aliiroseovarius salicola TaxID=3009082 RepID=A0ABT4W107_9RHOB|nr:alpha/beta hydrolase [Aliiroseovarius sp. KMU-50]MDA5093453.1 alpha/beta hydrolase [Aliiroseovarius sp. KMU-50]
MSRRLIWFNRFSRRVIKPALTRIGDPKLARRGLGLGVAVGAGFGVLFRPPPQTRIREGNLGSIPCQWVVNREDTHPPHPDRVMLYLHGGGYVAGSPQDYTHLLARLARLTQMKVCAPNYRKAPEHPFPAAFDDVVAAYEGLLEDGYAPGQIVIGGDSAGGGLAFALLAHLNAQNMVPHSVFAFSPFTDATFSGLSMSENVELDPMLPAEMRDEVATWILSGHAPEDPRISPLFAPFSAPLPPVFLQVSNTEILRDDSLRLAEKLRAAGAEVTVDLWADTPHVWVFFSRLLPEAKEALRRVAKFVQDVDAMERR